MKTSLDLVILAVRFFFVQESSPTCFFLNSDMIVTMDEELAGEPLQSSEH